MNFLPTCTPYFNTSLLKCTRKYFISSSYNTETKVKTILDNLNQFPK